MASGNMTRITEMYTVLGRESENIVRNVISICYFMRGGISYDDLMFRTPGERDLISNFLEDRLDKEGKRDNPNY